MAEKVLIGTTNPSKVQRFEKLLAHYDVEFLTLKDLDISGEPEETGSTPEENAVLKAKFYGRYFDRVICNDSGLYLDELAMEDPRQPGLKIRTPEGIRLDDEEMIKYYSALAHSLGGKVLAYYLDGLAVYENGKIASLLADRTTARKRAFYLVDQASEKRCPGWPLDSLSLELDGKTYFVEDEWNTGDFLDEEYDKCLTDFLAEALGLKK